MSKSDKTEKPTAKKKRDTRQKGQIAKSQDLTAWAGLLVGLYVLPWSIGGLADVTTEAFAIMRGTSNEPSPDLAVRMLADTLRGGFLAVAPLMAVVAFASIAATLGQTGLVLSLKPLKPDVKRISPKQGIQRLFSVRSLWETAKQMIKVTIVIAIAWPRVTGLVEHLAGHGRLPLASALPAAGSDMLGLVRTIAWVVFVLSFADYGYQRYQHGKDLMMTKQEVRDEHRNSEGDGMIKGRMRAMQRQMARNRMLADMGDADVVITNPTHVAVAIRYDASRGRAPVVLASGANDMAKRIRERATESSIPIVEAKPLARALWRACDPGDEIPAVLYEAVAQVLAFVRRLDRHLALAGRRHTLPSHTTRHHDLLDAVPRKRR